MTKFYDDGVTIIAIITIFIGAFSMAIKLCFKSKCSDITCCYGLLNIKRNVGLESDIETDVIPTQHSF